MERDINSLIVKLRSPYLIVHLVSLWFHRVQLEENAHGVPQMLDPTAIPLIYIANSLYASLEIRLEIAQKPSFFEGASKGEPREYGPKGVTVLFLDLLATFPPNLS